MFFFVLDLDSCRFCRRLETFTVNLDLAQFNQIAQISPGINIKSTAGLSFYSLAFTKTDQNLHDRNFL